VIVIRFVIFVFLFQDLIAGFEPHLPLLPKPDLNPLDLALEVEPLESGCDADLDFCFCVAIICEVCFLQYGQYLFVVFGNFIFLFLWSQMRVHKPLPLTRNFVISFEHLQSLKIKKLASIPTGLRVRHTFAGKLSHTAPFLNICPNEK
jgi:hypothetical protein